MINAKCYALVQVLGFSCLYSRNPDRPFLMLHPCLTLMLTQQRTGAGLWQDVGWLPRQDVSSSPWSPIMHCNTTRHQGGSTFYSLAFLLESRSCTTWAQNATHTALVGLLAPNYRSNRSAQLLRAALAVQIMTEKEICFVFLLRIPNLNAFWWFNTTAQIMWSNMVKSCNLLNNFAFKELSMAS